MSVIINKQNSTNRSHWPMYQVQILLGVLLSLLIVAFNVFNPYDKPLETLWLASAVVLLGFWPLYQWLGDRRRDAIPVLAMHSVFYAIAFGIAGLQEPVKMPTLDWTSEYERQLALLMVLLGLLSLYFGYFYMGPLIYGKQARWQWPFQVRPSGYSFIVTIAYPVILVIDNILNFNSVIQLTQISHILLDYVFFVLLYSYFKESLTGAYRMLFILLILPYKLVFGSGLAEGAIAGIFTTLIFIGIVYYSTRKRVPYIFILLAFSIFMLLQPIKSEFRAMTWNQQSTLSPIEKLQTFFGLGLDYYFYGDQLASQASEGLNQTYSRINHLMVTAAIIADTPENQPFLYGESYIPILTKFIPRFLWPDKPLEDLGNRWGRAYGYLGIDDYVTSFNLPWLPEMYMNFGVAGVIGISFFIGLVFHILAVNFWANPQTPSAFAFGMVIGMPLIFVESNLSMMFGGLFIIFITLMTIGYVSAKLMPRLFAWGK